MGLVESGGCQKTWTYFPIQKLENILPNKSSEVNSPVISLSACWARRNSSASKR
jgi:hypothetical protein